MFPFRKILFPVDYSVPCQAVVPYVQEMVKHFSAELTLVHGYGAEAFSYGRLPIVDADWAEKVQEREQQHLQEFAHETFPWQHVECFAKPYEAGTAIHEVIQHQGTDLVMMATHGLGPVRRLLLGSVTAKVLHDASAAVWTGTGAALIERAPDIPYQSILCAVDQSDEAEGVLKAAVAFANTYQAQLSLVQVVEAPQESLEIDFTPYREELIEVANRKLNGLKKQLGVDAPHTVLDSDVASGVRQEAILRKADLIVAGRGHAQTKFSMIWSHLYEIVREAPCPVLSI